MRHFAIATQGCNKLDVSEVKVEIERKLVEERKQERFKEIVEDLRGGRKMTDFRFDQVYPREIRNLSGIHWTPVEVAVRAAELLAESNNTRVLDVGSGCGKFCTVAALSCPGQFIGVEQRPHLIEVAQKVIEDLNVKNASFIQSNMATLDWSSFDGFYLYNPFYEHKVKSIRIDTTLSYSQDKFVHYVEIVKSKLRQLSLGSRVVTYHGFGGDLPPGYQCVKKEPAGSSYLELWVKMEESKEIGYEILS
jgi:hypothetical protein